jgi:hypothetical protein
MAPSKTKYLTESKVLPFEPTMQDILEVYKYFQDKYACIPTEVIQEERGDWETCLVFCREVPNVNYEKEMALWLASNDEKRVAIQSKKNQKDSDLARIAWKASYRIIRLSRSENQNASA